MDEKTIVILDEPEKKSKEDLDMRKTQEKTLDAQMTKLFALKERMYQIRFDNTITDERKKQIDLRNLAVEINRVQSALLSELHHTNDNFEDSLELHDIGLDNIFHDRNADLQGFIRTKSADGGFVRTPSSKTGFSKKSVSSKTGFTTKSSSSKGSLGSKGNSTKGGFTGHAAGPGLMKTPSAKIVGEEPKTAWNSLMDMFKEWTFQNEVADAQHIITRPVELSKIEDDIARLRGAIRTMKDRKDLSPQDQLLLENLTDELKMRMKQKERIVAMEYSLPEPEGKGKGKAREESEETTEDDEEGEKKPKKVAKKPRDASDDSSEDETEEEKEKKEKREKKKD